MGKNILNESYIFGISIKTDSFDVSVNIKIQFRVLDAIELSHFLLTVRYLELLIKC